MKLNPRPWCERWERFNLKGIEPLDLPQKFWDRMKHPQIAQPWLKHDLMRQYRYILRCYSVNNNNLAMVTANSFCFGDNR